LPSRPPEAHDQDALESDPQPDEEEDQSDEETTFLERLRHLDGGTVVAFCCGSVALLLASLPYLGLLSKPLSGLGLLVGLGVSLWPAWRGRTPVWVPLAASALCLATLLFVGSLSTAPAPPPAHPLAVDLRQGGMVAHQPLREDDWVDASASAIQWHNLRVQIVSVQVGRMELQAEKKTVLSPQSQLLIQVRVSYQGSAFQEIPYESWADQVQAASKHPPALSDSLERHYAQSTFDPALKIKERGERGSLTPGRLIDEALIYPVPPPEAEYLRLTLPASAFGASGVFRFQIPRAMIKSVRP
jgi:hypothetical protein